MVNELTGTVIIDLGLIVGERPFDLPWDVLGEERFTDFPLVIQLEYSARKSTIWFMVWWLTPSLDLVEQVGRRLREPLDFWSPSLRESPLRLLLVGLTRV